MTQDDTELAGRIRRLEDRAELWELVSRYAVAVDDEDYGALRTLFAAGGEFTGLVGGTQRGRDGVVEYLRHRNDTDHVRRVHTPTAQFLDQLEGDRAAGVVSSYAALYSADGSLRFFAFRYDDRYVREDGQWRFASRTIGGLTNLIPSHDLAS